MLVGWKNTAFLLKAPPPFLNNICPGIPADVTAPDILGSMKRNLLMPLKRIAPPDPQLFPESILNHRCCVFVSIGFASFTEITKDFDENKENKTPEGTQGEVDWLQQYDMEREREEQELQQALAQSLQEQVRANVAPRALEIKLTARYAFPGGRK